MRVEVILVMFPFQTLLNLGVVRIRALRSAKEHACSRMKMSISGGNDSKLGVCCFDGGFGAILATPSAADKIKLSQFLGWVG